MNLAWKAIFVALYTASSTVFAQEDFPNKPVRLIVPWPPGALSDGVSRLVAIKLSEEWKQPVVVENKAGANGIIGADFVAKSKADGYTLLNSNTDTDTLNRLLYASVPYDATRDLKPVAMMATQGLMLLTHPSYKAVNLQQMVSDAKARPGTINYASWGRGGVSHMTMEQLKGAASIDLMHVPYKGATPAVADVISGHVEMMFAGAATGVPLYRAGKVRVLGISTSERNPQMPEVPTIAEQGFPGFSAETWNGISAPTGTPAVIVQKINSAVQRALSDPTVSKQLIAQGATVVRGSPEQYRDFIKGNTAKWEASVTALGIKPE